MAAGSTKRCTACHRDLPVTSFSSKCRPGGGLRSQCRECISAAKRARYATDQAFREAAKARGAKERAELADTYIKRLLCRDGLRWEDVTPALIAAKREALQHRRIAGEAWQALEPYEEELRRARQEQQGQRAGTPVDREEYLRRAREKSRVYYWANLEKAREKMKRWKAANPEKLAAQRQRAKQRKPLASVSSAMASAHDDAAKAKDDE